MGIYGRRRAVAAAGLAGALLLFVLIVKAVAGCGGGGTATTAKAPPIPQLPRGGTQILPRFRVVAYYGAPQDAQLGILGIGSPSTAAHKLVTQAQRYRVLGKPVLPAMELLADVADHAPGDSGQYRTRQPDAIIARYLKAARRAHALLVLDIQPGYSDFLSETMHLRKWLAQPDVSLALDPEWHLHAPDIPGQVIGSVDAVEINAVSFWLDRLTADRHLPQKLLLIHRFTPGMIKNGFRIKHRRHLAIAINVDGFGNRVVKIAKYDEFAKLARGFYNGFKLFFHEDTNILRPRDIGKVRPLPDVIVYE